MDFGGIRVHSMREIAANQICALLGRAELRDLVDLRALLQRGIDLRAALTDAVQKDGGVSPDPTLAWLLQGLRLPADSVMPGNVPVSELEALRADLVVRLRTMAWPG